MKEFEPIGWVDKKLYEDEAILQHLPHAHVFE